MFPGSPQVNASPSCFQRQGENKQTEARAENAASHTVAKIGSVNASPSGAITTDDPNRTEGSWNQTIGSAKETVGGLVGAQGLKNEGIQQNQEGKAQEAQGQASDLVDGVKNRVGGAVGGATAGLLGDRQKQAEYEAQHAIGKTQQRSVEKDLDWQNV